MTSREEPSGAVAVTAGLAGLGAAALAAAFLLFPSVGGLPARGDLPDFFWPMKAYTASRWRAGELALWNPLSACGEPWLAQLQSGVLNPLDLPFLLPFPWGPRAAVAALLVVAASGMAAWLYRLGASRAASFTAGLLYAGGGPFLSLLLVFNNAATAAWLPWLFATARGAVLGARPARFAVVLALAVLAGEPALAVAGAVAAALTAFAAGAEGERGVFPPRRRAAGTLAAGALLGIALAGAVLVPFAELVAASGRLSGTSRQEALARPVGLSDLADLALPPSPAGARSAVPGRGGYLVTLSFGLLPLGLAAGAAAGFPGRPRLLAALAAVGAIAFLASLGERGLVSPALYHLGPFRGLRFPARWFTFVHLALSFAAGAGLDGWLYGRFGKARSTGGADEPAPDDPVELLARQAGRRSRAFALAGAGLIAVTLLLSLLTSGTASRDARGTLVLAGTSAVAVALVLLRRRGLLRPSPAPLLGILAVLPLPLVAGAPLEMVPADDLRSAPPIARQVPCGAGAPRILPAVKDASLLAAYLFDGGGAWTPELPLRARRAFSGYTNLDLGLASAASASPIPNPSVTRLFGAALAGGNLARLLGLGNVRWVVTPFPAGFPGARIVARDGAVHLYDLGPGMGRVFFPEEVREAPDGEVFEALCQSRFEPEKTAFVAPVPEASTLPRAPGPRRVAMARVKHDAPERLEVETVTSESALLVITRAHATGWQVELDGLSAPLRRVDLALMGVVVPPGTHRVALRYLPASVVAGAAVSAAALLVLAALSLRAPWRPGR